MKVFDFVLKLWGASLAGVIFFTPINLNFDENILTISTRLENQVTEDIDKLINQGFVFKVDHYSSIIINDKKVHKTNVIKSIDKDNYDLDSFSNLEIVFNDIEIVESDELLLFIKSKIVDDELFKESTGLDTEVLWKNYVPREKRYYLYKNGKFIEK